MARVWPCGLNATEEKASPWVLMSGAAMGWLAPTSHNHTVPAPPSLVPAARVLPSGLNATEVIGPPGPLTMSGVPTGRWVATSHNRTLPSSLPAARVLPSGLDGTEVTAVGPL